MRSVFAFSFHILLTFVLGITFTGCTRDDTDPASKLESTHVLTHENLPLSVHIKCSFTQSASARIKYWPATENEAGAIVSAISDVKRNHTFSVFELKEKTAYHYKVIHVSENGTETDAGQIQHFTSGTLPAWLATYYTQDQNVLQENLPGYYLFVPASKPNGLFLVDKTGKIAWCWSPPSNTMVKTARFTPKGSLLILIDENSNPMADGNVLLETTLAGDTLSYFRMGEKGFDKSVHHDIQMDENGNIIAITNEMQNGFPGDGILVLNSQGQKIWEWSTFSELTQIDPATYAQPWGNSLVIDKDHNYIVSFRALSQVWKINATTGKVMWKLGKNGTVKMPEGSQFMFQHFAHRNASDDIMLFDNGAAARPHTRILSFTLNESTLEATTKINLTLPNDAYSVIMGSTGLLPDGNVLSASAMTGKLLKTDLTGIPVWTLKTASPIYRAEYITNPFGK
ncbi:aryl-sulfate sulfotransferase [Xanthocytophaga flava]|uniref:aryl-sulfate sulfotransferase n=1 Tax=Xanthocytophaga flava TaxID=3048013 RepID=UPI0028D139CF|nr:aryl-sulfate sulfotransferase [Xanthocytophaga flavus]MDJ1471022.1 aryl-sulfate sulfotransferase [Xanthocytophaga flavus]